jgi:hypothetical protein
MKRLLLFCSLSLLALSSACASSPAAPAAEPPGTQPAYPSYPSYPSEPVRPIQTYLPPAQPADPENPYAPLPQDARLQAGPAYLDDYELQTVSTFPPEYVLTLRGSLPTPCHALRVRVQASESEQRIDIEVYSVSDPNAICTQVLQPFDASIPLRNLVPVRYTVWLNGEKIGEIEG